MTGTARSSVSELGARPGNGGSSRRRAYLPGSDARYWRLLDGRTKWRRRMKEKGEGMQQCQSE